MELAELIGEAAASKLMQIRGGVRVYIPSVGHLKPEHWLVSLLGLETAQTLCLKFAGATINVPLENIPARRELIKRLLDQGLSLQEVALAAGVHVKTVSRIKKACLDSNFVEKC